MSTVAACANDRVVPHSQYGLVCKRAVKAVMRFRHGRLAIATGILVAIIITALLAPVLSPHEPNKVALAKRLTPPCWMAGGSRAYPLGTDQLGRDLLSRILYGARVSLTVGFISVLSSGTVGTALGLISGFYGGWVDKVIMRLTDIQMALPFMLMALLVVAMLGPSLPNIVIVFTVTAWYRYARVVRASTLSLREQDWVLAARACGVRNLRILVRHILPHVLSVLLVLSSFEIARIIITEAALGFLGLGVPPPHPTWGNTLSDGREYIQDAWWISVFPGLALVTTVLGINILGDSLRDALDPTLRKQQERAQ